LVTYILSGGYRNTSVSGGGSSMDWDTLG